MQCPALEPIPNGVITYGPDMMADFDVGTMATYSCDFGFLPVGSVTQLCISGGIWTDQPPVCERKIHLQDIGSGKANTIIMVQN